MSVAVGRDSTLPILTAIRLEASEGTLNSVATDRYCLALVRSAIATADELAMNVPRAGFAFLVKHFGGEVRIELQTHTPHGAKAPSTLVVRAGRRVVTQRLQEGEFPKYRTLLPAESSFTANADVDVPSFVKAVRRLLWWRWGTRRCA